MTPLVLALALAVGGPIQSDESLRRARRLEASGELESALEAYDSYVERHPDDWRGPMLRGALRFRRGDNAGALQDFDRVVALSPEQEPYLWQRGISQYYAGDDDACIRQFELHRTVNPADVENAVWHFLCVARRDGVEAARKHLLPVGSDARPPMPTVYRMFAGEASPEEVQRDAQLADSAAADFYASLYLGLYLHATGEAARALPYIRRAAESGIGGYMGDVARAHLTLMLDPR